MGVEVFQDGSSHAHHPPEDLDLHHPTFVTPDLTTFCRLDELGLQAVGQLLEPDRAVLECRVVEDDPWCRKCGAEGVPRDTVTRPLAHEPFGHRPTTLLVRVRRYRCTHCRRTWRQDTSKAAAPREKISRGGIGWALTAIVVDHLTVSRAAAGLGVSWHTANTAIIAEGKRRLIDDPARFDGVTTIGVDEHVWRHTRFGEKYVTVIIDLTPTRNKTGPARLLDMVEGRSKQVFKEWLAARPAEWSSRIEVVAMDGFSGFKTAAAEELPDAVPVMDPFHVVRLAGDALDRTRQRVQQDTLGHRGHAGDPLYGVRRTLHTGASFLTEKQTARLDAVFAAEEHVEAISDLGHLPAHRRRLPRTRQEQGEGDDAGGDRLCQQRRPRAAQRGPSPRPHTEAARRGHPRVLRPPRNEQRPNGGHQRPARAPSRFRPRLPEPHALRRQIAPRSRRIQTAPTLSFAMSPLTGSSQLRV